METKTLMHGEACLINTMFQRNGIRAKVDRAHTVCIETGYISYALQLAMTERFVRVEGLQRELTTVLGNARRRCGLPGDVQAIPVNFPRLALELPHPQPKPLLATNAVLTGAAPHAMLAGRSYIEGPQNEYVVFDDTPHVLVAGITGAGKSVLLQVMLLSLAFGTAPTECRFVLVDLKNEDLAPFEALPHTLTFAGTKAAALDALRWVQAEKDKRVANRGYKPYRVVLVIDEMAQLAGNGEARDILGDLASIGRSKGVNLIGATQHPTKEGGLGALLKANFGVRLVGQVAPGQSQYATNRPQTHADLLPGRGAFLRCQGRRVYRFQGFYVAPDVVTNMAFQVAQQWRNERPEPPEPVLTHTSPLLVVEPSRTALEPVLEPPRTVTEPVLEPQFPLPEKRRLSSAEASKIRRLNAEGTSKTELCRLVYGSKNGQYMEWINEALQAAPGDNKIIKMRRTGTGGD